MSLNSQPRAAFGQRREARPPEAPPAPAPQPSRPRRRKGPPPRVIAAVILSLGALTSGGLAYGLWASPAMHRIAASAAQSTQAVVEIVNQPVTHLARTANATVFSPGWFHDGALTPDFAMVDVRASQEFPYKDSRYVTSDVTPSEMFLGDELEFNAMTKIFYRDRTLPKARLSEPEMVKINALYRSLAHDAQSLTAWRNMVAGLVVAVLLLAATPLLLTRRAPTPDDGAAS